MKYRLWGRLNQPKVKIDMKNRVSPLKIRKARRETTESVSSSDSGTWIPEGEGFGYPPKQFTDYDYPQTSDEEENKEKNVPRMKMMGMPQWRILTVHTDQCN